MWPFAVATIIHAHAAAKAPRERSTVTGRLRPSAPGLDVAARRSFWALRSDGPERTEQVGRAIGALARPGDLVLLTGELGAGKTRLAQGALSGLGSSDHVRSPTFVLVMEHAARIPLYHVDLYRLERGSDLDSLGLDEYVGGDGLCLVEWADRAPVAFPAGRLEILIGRLEGRENDRTLALTAGGDRHCELLAGVIDSVGSPPQGG